MEADVYVCARGGLCNRLRVMVSFLCAARKLGCKLVVYWQSNSLCPAEWNDLFQALPPDCEIRSRIAPAGTYTTCHRHPDIPVVEWAPMVDTLLRPTPALQQRISRVLGQLGENFTAVHIRRTDHNSNYAEDRDFLDFAKKAPGKIFVAADNPQSLATLKGELGDRVIHSAVFRKGGRRLTSVQDAVVDLWVSRRAARFKGTFYSSFSDWIEMLRQGEPGDLSPRTNDRRVMGAVPPLPARIRIAAGIAGGFKRH
jgi:hypothetical protein